MEGSDGLGVVQGALIEGAYVGLTQATRAGIGA
jgi:hypothetical protein